MNSRGVLVLLLFLAACDMGELDPVACQAQPSHAENVRRVRRASFELAVSYEDGPVAGHAFPVTFQIRNLTDRDAFWDRINNKWANFSCSVLDKSGKAVPYTRFGTFVFGRADRAPKGHSSRTEPLPAGSTVTRTINVARLFDLSRSGQYVLRAEVLVGYKIPIVLRITDLPFAVTEPKEGKTGTVGSEDPATPKKTLTTTTEQFDFSVSYHQKLIAGHACPVTFTLKNVDAKAGTWDRNLSLWGAFALELKDKKGSRVHRTRFAVRLLGERGNPLPGKDFPVRLKPNQAVTATINIARLFDLTVAGDYKLDGWVGPRRGQDYASLPVRGLGLRVLEPEQ